MPANEPVNEAGWPNRRTPLTSAAPTKSSGCGSGGRPTPAIGEATKGSLRVRYKMSAPIKLLIIRLLRKGIRKISLAVRYKMSAGLKLLCWWDFSPNCLIPRYKRTSWGSPVAW
jgi:hypothetical protein